MEPKEWRAGPSSSVVLNMLIVSAVRFLRESLVEILGRVPGIQVCGEAATLPHALDLARSARPAILLLDVAFPGGPQTAMRLSAAAPESDLVAVGICETEEDVLAWAEAGIAGYVPNTASIEDLVALIGEISRGEQSCPSNIAGSLLRRVARTPRAVASAALPSPPLTRRELEILSLVGAGLSNKDIARRLSISLGTTKSHVHNLLGKLSLQRRAEVIARLRGSPSPLL